MPYGDRVPTTLSFIFIFNVVLLDTVVNDIVGDVVPYLGFNPDHDLINYLPMLDNTLVVVVACFQTRLELDREAPSSSHAHETGGTRRDKRSPIPSCCTSYVVLRTLYLQAQGRSMQRLRPLGIKVKKWKVVQSASGARAPIAIVQNRSVEEKSRCSTHSVALHT